MRTGGEASSNSAEVAVELRVQPGGRLRGRIGVPGDKSISHRVLLLGAVADGVTRVSHFLEGEDSLATLAAVRAMGVTVQGPKDGRLAIEGVGMNGLCPPRAPLNLGNSGTALRLLAGLLCAQPFDAVLTGDASLCSRPMRRVIDPLTRMGACIEATAHVRAPLTVHGGRRLNGIDYEMPMASAQVKSALLLAGLYARGRTCVGEPGRSRDHTERMLVGFGYPVEYRVRSVCVRGGGRLVARDLTVPGDFSSAAFLLLGTLIAPGSDLVIEGVGVNPTRTGALQILRTMGGRIEQRNERTMSGEPVADLCVHASDLHGITIPEEWVPLAIDEFPAIFVAAAVARGETVLRGAGELRLKESDRIAVMAEGLRTLGVQAEPISDGMVIRGGAIRGGTVNSGGDHRVAMAFAFASLRAKEPIVVTDCANVRTSFPDFAATARAVGLPIEEHRVRG